MISAKRRKFWVKALAAVLAFCMIGSVLAVLVSMIIN